MNRRDFLRDLFVTFVAALVPWKPRARAMGGIVPKGTSYCIGGPLPNGIVLAEREEGEIFTANTEWYTYNQPLTWQHSIPIDLDKVFELIDTHNLNVVLNQEPGVLQS